MTPKNIEGFAKFFQYSFFLKTHAHANIEIAKQTKAITAAKACIKPVRVGGTTGTPVGNMVSNKNAIQKMPRNTILF